MVSKFLSQSYFSSSVLVYRVFQYSGCANSASDSLLDMMVVGDSLRDWEETWVEKKVKPEVASENA